MRCDVLWILFVVVVIVIVVLPPLVYVCVKLAAVAFLRGSQRFEQLEKERSKDGESQK